MKSTKSSQVMLLLTLAVLLLYYTKVTQGEGDAGEPEMSAAKGNFTTIAISGEALTIKAADGYAPVVKTNDNKPIIILERDSNSDSSDTVTVTNNKRITIVATDDL